MSVIIRRYGRYINQKADNEIESWIKDNVTDLRGRKIYETASLEKCYDIAERKGYSFSKI